MVGQDIKSSSDNSVAKNYMQVLFVTAVVEKNQLGQHFLSS